MPNSYIYIIYLFVFALMTPGCTPSKNFTATSGIIASLASPSPTSQFTAISGAKAAQIIFTSSTGGSFTAPASRTVGTLNAAGSGLQAVRVFNPDGTILSSSNNGSANSTWPQWLTSFEIGLSGSLNRAATNPNCATFADQNEASLTNCALASPTPNSQCGAPLGQFRVSEADCSTLITGLPTTATGTGSSTDGITLRAVFNRAYMGASENMLVVLQYAASSLNPAPVNPTTCFSGGQFLPELCSDFTWRAYLKHSVTEVTLPFLLLIPPTFSSVLGPNLPASGTGITAKQFLLPLAADPTLSVLQISRTQSNFPNLTQLQNYCSALGSVSVNSPANSPLCAGVIFYSITFFRM